MKKKTLIFCFLTVLNPSTYADFVKYKSSQQQRLDKLSEDNHTNENSPTITSTNERSVYYYKDKKGGSFLTSKKSNNPELTLVRVTKEKSSDDLGVWNGISKPEHKNERNLGSIIVESDGTYTGVPEAFYTSSSSNKAKKTVTNVAKFYKPTDIKPELTKYFEYLKPNEDVKIIDNNDTNVDYEDLGERGYAPLGLSKFRDRKLLTNDVIEQAKKIGASLVIFSKSTDTTVHYNEQDDPNNFDIIYDYVVLFLVKDSFSKQPNMLGISMIDIPIQERSLYQRNTGIYVRLVTKESKAYNSNILKGDVIIAVNGIPTLRQEDFPQIRDEELRKTKTLNFKILRIVKGEVKEVEIPINF